MEEKKFMDKWSAEKANDWSKKQGWLRGFNYRPADCRNSVEIFQEYGFTDHLPLMESEFALAASIGFNTMRLINSCEVWRDQHDGYMARLEKIIELAYKSGIKTMLSFGNDCCPPKSLFVPVVYGPQPLDLGYHGGVKNTPHKSYGEAGYNPFVDEPDGRRNLIAMTKEIVKRYADDERVVVLDIFNEPGNGRRGSMSLDAMREMFAVARNENPIQPLTAGIWSYDIDFEKGELYFTGNCGEIQQAALDLSDVISYHDYGIFTRSAALIKVLKNKYNRPLFNTEWLNRIQNNSIFDQYPLMMAEKVNCYCWGLVAGKSQTFEPWESMWQSVENGTAPKEWDLTKWMHDLFRISHRPYDPEEIELIKRINVFADAVYKP